MTLKGPSNEINQNELDKAMGKIPIGLTKVDDSPIQMRRGKFSLQGMRTFTIYPSLILNTDGGNEQFFLILLTNT